ncbi:MAG: hypothetical protein IJC68_01800 [Firmicutes bacterium]|nr:hypothetical protein [Bacillota bacterium]
MKNYPKLFALTGSLLILQLLLSGFLLSGTAWDTVQQLLLQRTAFMEQACYGELTLQEAENALSAIEVQPLLRQDVEGIRQQGNAGLERVKDLRILVLERLHSYAGKETYRMQVEWTLSTGNGLERETVFYYLVLEEVGGEMRMAQLEPIL